MTINAIQLMTTLSPLITATKGDLDRQLHTARSITQPTPGALTYLKPGFARLNDIAVSLAGMGVICSEAHADQLAEADVTCLITDSPRLAFMRAVDQFFSRRRPSPGVHPRAVVEPSATIDPTASIGANCYVGAGCTVGARSVLYPNVTLMDDVRLGADVTIASGTVVGADGFGYERNEDAELEKFPHIGGVVIEDNVEIGSNTSIDRGTLGDTIIRSGARIDNQCHISHNVDIGHHAAVIAQSMMGGSAVAGDYSWLAPAAIIMNQAKIGARATVGLGAVVVKDVPAGLTVMGSPAIPADEFRAQRAAVKKLLG
jgi:UDP-3-O-[3-hydroxymyristoyl] glucosamine N-acyltransferase